MAGHKPTKNKAEIGLADLVLVMKKLGYDNDKVVAQYFETLGFNDHTHSKKSPEAYRSTQAVWNRTRVPHEKTSRAAVKYHPSATIPAPPEKNPPIPEKTLDSGFEELGIETANITLTEMPEQYSNADSIPINEKTAPMTRRLSLFPASKSRAIISEVVSQKIQGRDLDIQGLIANIVQQKPLSNLPILPEITSRNGCQLLLDINDALMPWWPDMQELIKQFHTVLGEAACPVYEFDHSPFDATRWTEKQGDIAWKGITNKPVIIATDLGVRKTPDLSLRANLDIWKKFSTYCQRRQVPLIVLVPLNPLRWPKGLKTSMQIIHWHPATSAALVKRLQKKSSIT